MEKDFSLSESIYLKKNHNHYDIHNDYDFEKLILDSEINQLNIYLVKGAGDWIKKEDPSKIVILFEGIEHVSFSKGFFKEKNSTIEEFGYKSEGDFDLLWLKSEDQTENGDHLIIRFENNEYLRIYSKRATAVI